MTAAAVRRFRNRGAFLVTIGAAWVGYGLGIICDPRYGTARGLVHITAYVPLRVLGCMWVVCGAVSVLGALLGCARGQATGFLAIATPAAIWGAAFTITWAGGGYPSASGSACGWAGFALGILWVSGMDDPPPRPRTKGVVARE
ncbi:hypothetical protein ACH4YN_38125 [Streptomyces griseofuscus]|uniref:hypothetical protein n=1 Tax=Streptomyces griseofuscus TaxID=146922 RepID=UPI0037A7C41B